MSTDPPSTTAGPTPTTTTTGAPSPGPTTTGSPSPSPTTGSPSPSPTGSPSPGPTTTGSPSPGPTTGSPSPGPTTTDTPTPGPSVVSPCPHVPKCPPPVCLPPSLLPTGGPPTGSGKPSGNSRNPKDPDGKTNLPGYETRTGSIDAFAGSMTGTAQGVGLVKDTTPRFEGWNLAPVAGVPLVGRMFVGRYNRIADTWSDSAGILRGVLDNDAAKVTRAAQNYRAAEQARGTN